MEKKKYKKQEAEVFYVVAKEHGDGVLPDLDVFNVKACTHCISGSGGSICNGYRGYTEIATDKDGHKIYRVKCAANL